MAGIPLACRGNNFNHADRQAWIIFFSARATASAMFGEDFDPVAIAKEADEMCAVLTNRDFHGGPDCDPGNTACDDNWNRIRKTQEELNAMQREEMAKAKIELAKRKEAQDAKKAADEAEKAKALAAQAELQNGPTDQKEVPTNAPEVVSQEAVHSAPTPVDEKA